MSEIIRMKSVEPVLHGVVKVVWLDGYEAIVDLRPVIAEGDIFAFLRGSPERFDEVKLAEFGHATTMMATRSTSARTSFAAAPNAKPKFSGSPANV
jgi:hypothetical protein